MKSLASIAGCASRVGQSAEWIILPGRTLAQLEESIYRAAYARHGGCRYTMQAELRVSRSTLFRALKRHGLA